MLDKEKLKELLLEHTFYISIDPQVRTIHIDLGHTDINFSNDPDNIKKVNTTIVDVLDGFIKEITPKLQDYLIGADIDIDNDEHINYLLNTLNNKLYSNYLDQIDSLVNKILIKLE